MRLLWHIAVLPLFASADLLNIGHRGVCGTHPEHTKLSYVAAFEQGADFVECDALQCGFCTPGMIMACSALLSDNPKPAHDEAARGIAGNICRCGTFDNILDAVELAASGKVKERRR